MFAFLIHKNIFRLTTQFFEMSILSVEADASGYDDECVPLVPTPAGKSDFLSIREGTTVDSDGATVVVNRFCGTSLAANAAVTCKWIIDSIIVGCKH